MGTPPGQTGNGNGTTGGPATGDGATGNSTNGVPGTDRERGDRDWSGGGGVGGFLGGGGISGVSSELITLLQNGSKGYTWAAAAVTANGAAPLQIASGEPIMAIGGFNGTDPAPSLAEFQELVAQGKIHYFIGSGGGGMGRPERHLERDRHLGRGELPGPDRRQHHRLRPHHQHHQLRNRSTSYDSEHQPPDPRGSRPPLRQPPGRSFPQHPPRVPRPTRPSGRPPEPARPTSLHPPLGSEADEAEGEGRRAAEQSGAGRSWVSAGGAGVPGWHCGWSRLGWLQHPAEPVRRPGRRRSPIPRPARSAGPGPRPGHERPRPRHHRSGPGIHRARPGQHRPESGHAPRPGSGRSPGPRQPAQHRHRPNPNQLTSQRKEQPGGSRADTQPAGHRLLGKPRGGGGSASVRAARSGFVGRRVDQLLGW